MSKEYYQYSGPRSKISLKSSEEDAREDYVKSRSNWTFTNIWDYSDKLKLQKDNDPLWCNCLKNLSIALQLKEECDMDYGDFWDAHLYECFDLSQ